MFEEMMYNNRCEKDAVLMKAYMRNQFEFLGVKSPKRKLLQREYFKGFKGFDESVARDLYKNKYREFKYTSIDFLIKFKKHLEEDHIDFLREIILIEPWWDTVDIIGSNLVGALAFKYKDLVKSHMEPWALDENIWISRTSIIFQLRYKENTDRDFLEYTIGKNKDKKEFFIEKAIGWALREYSKTDGDWVRDFIKRYDLRPLSKREAMKHLSKG